ncbi:MAG TPA: 16S rRNA (guanine(527)-N(7))-methyltransferase RsmG [Candidatus Limnocylindria bacterium]|nr:16S rRNA (guanine(527)-N(7))-methyltransferase RsmG [Candidatus Limnocylindria bacterium]
MAQPDGAHAAAREVARALEALLADEPLLAARLPDGFVERAAAYAGLLLDANRRLNLTRVTEPAEVARLHLLDAMAALPLLDELQPATAVDLGSGGGVPGIPLALARPGTRWILVDSVRKKADALQAMVDRLDLDNVTVLAERAELIGRDEAHRERHDLVAARACAPLPVLAELAMPLLAVGGTLLAWKGPLTEADEEMRRGRAAIGQLGGGQLAVRPSLPALGGHTFVHVPKTGATPARFPRRPGEPARRPLG